VTDGEKKDGDCDEVIRSRCGEQDKVDGTKKKAHSTIKVMHIKISGY